MEKLKTVTNLESLLRKIEHENIAYTDKSLKLLKIPEVMKLYIPNEIGETVVFNICGTLESFDKLLLSFKDHRKWHLTQTFEKMKLTQIEVKPKQIIAHWSCSDFFYVTKSDGSPIWLAEWIEYREKLECSDDKWII